MFAKHMCYACEEIFEVINEENPREYRCPQCQSAYRIMVANKMHKTGVFPDRDGYLMQAHNLRFPNNEVKWGDDNPAIYRG